MDRASPGAGWDVLLDSAAFVPTNRHEALAKLRRPWFAGGTITIASVQGDGYFHHDNEAAFEDGTLDYLNLPAASKPSPASLASRCGPVASRKANRLEKQVLLQITDPYDS